jgi:hypothetical protein
MALIEAKGICYLHHYRGQALVEMVSLKRVELQDNRKWDWEEAQNPAVSNVFASYSALGFGLQC